jgi:hypothetical protein
MLQLCGLSLTHLELLVSLMQLSLKVVDVALGSGQLVLSVLQSSEGIAKEVSLEVTAAISPHQLIIQFLDTCLKASVLLEKLLDALPNIIDGVVLGLHLTGILLLKQGAHVLGVACRECVTRVVGRKLGVANGSHALTPHRVALVPNGEQGDDGAIEDWQVVPHTTP